MLWAIYTAMLYFDLAVAACAAWSIWAGLLAREGKKLGFMLCTFFWDWGSWPKDQWLAWSQARYFWV